jgi:glycosyltransferase involved in cell wall biosynthesis
MSKQELLVSIIMPAYNCEKYIGVAIDSVLNQTYTNFELLVADDGSMDSTKSIIDSYTDVRIRKFHNSKNLGYLKTCNFLAKKANGSYYTFLDADDINSYDRFNKQIEFLKKNEGISCVGTNIIKIDFEGSIISDSNFLLANNDMVNCFENYSVPCHYSTLLIKKEVIDSIGLYNEYFDRIGSEDVYWFSLMIEKFKVANISDKLYYYRKHPTSITATHKNPKALIGHDLVLFFYKRRKFNREDYIQSNKTKKTDSICKFLLLLKILPNKKSSVFFKYILLSIQYPSISILFIKDFMFKFLKK